MRIYMYTYVYVYVDARVYVCVRTCGLLCKRTIVPYSTFYSQRKHKQLEEQCSRYFFLRKFLNSGL